jgi:tetratricopeptide (TPR) repeat protein
MNATLDTLPKTPQVTADVASAPRRNYLLIGLGAAILLFALTYVGAWISAQSLTQEYLQNADQSYQNGDYLQALVGFQEFDENSRRYVSRGGYFQAQRIWASQYAWPIPAGVETANQRINEIINERITISDAEQFIQVNSGRGNPYLGIIYLRLGELYEQEGSLPDARDIYESIPELFASQQDLIERAEQHLQRLDSQTSP